ncbi:MAG TPA: PAS domain S-box protein [Chloroflexota bacterium]|nr:PAS domain S-box protein [Chloroflexota bacterium]
MQPHRSVVLVIEDDPSIAEILQQILEREGYGVEVVHDGATALDCVEIVRPDLVLLDLLLPDVNGIEVCQRIRARERDDYVPIIMLTAVSHPDQRRAGFAAGADDYVVKPFDTAELLARVQVWVQTRRRLTAAYEDIRREQARLAEEAANARVAAERMRSEITTQQLSAEVVRAYAAKEKLAAEAEAQARIFRALYEFGVAVGGVLDPGALARLAVDQARDLLGADAAALFWWEPEGESLRRLAYNGPLPVDADALPASEGLAAAALRERAPVVVADYAAWEQAAPWALAAGVGAVAAVALRVGDRAVGVLEALAHRPREFTAEQKQLLSLLAAQVAPALQAARLHDDAQRRRVEAEALAELARQGAATTDTERAIKLITDQACRLLGADYAGVSLLEADDTLSFHGMSGHRSTGWQNVRVPRDQGAAGRALAAGRTVLFERLGEVTAQREHDFPVHQAEGGQSALSTPLHGHGGALGALIVGWRTETQITTAQVRLAEAVASYAATILDSASAHAALAAQAEDLRRAAAERAAVIEHIPSGVVVVDAAGRTVLMNEAGRAISGALPNPRQPLADQADVFRLRYPATGLPIPPHATPVGRALAGETVHDFEYAFTRPGETEERLVQASAVPLHDAGGQITAALAVFSDVTRERRLVRDLAASEERYRRIVETSREGIWIIDAAGNTTFVNHRMAEMLGYGVDEMLGASFLSFMDATERTIALRNVARRREGIAEGHDFKFQRRDGTPLWAIVVTNPLFDDGGEYLGALAMVTDITERKQAEEQLARWAAIVEASEDAIIGQAIDGTIVDWNRGAERMFGYTAAEAVGQSGILIVPPDRVDELADILARVQRGESIEHLESERVCRDGRRLNVSISISPLRDAEGRVTGAATITRDVTAYKEAERQLKSLAQSEKLRALGQMASGVAHDLNQYLGLVAAHGSLARAALHQPTPALDDLEDSLNIIVQAAMDGGQTVKRLLTFARPRQQGPTERIDVGALLREVAKLTAPSWRDGAQEQGRPISLHVEAERDLLVDGSPEGLREVFTNLIFNAVDALPAGGTIRLAARREGGRIAVDVADSGVGMSPEVQAQVFDPFFTTKGERGTGLGLAMVFGLVQQHGGQIAVRSAVGKGTCFQLSFPAVDAGGGAEAAAPKPASAPAGLRILVVDDLPDLARAMARVLRIEGHTVETKASAEEALEYLATTPVDLVISDLGLGEGMNGWQLAEQVRSHFPRARFALATGWGDRISPEEAAARGVEAVIAKPYRVDDLHRLVAQLAGPRPAA